MPQTGWCLQAQGSPSVKNCLPYIGVMLLLFLFSSNVYAASDLPTILANVRRVIVPLTSMLLMISFVIGIAMIFSALAKMKKFGMMMTMMSQPGELGGPLVGIIVGAVLVYLPTSTNFLMNSLFSSANSIFGGAGGINYQAMGQGASLLSYSGSGGLNSLWADLANTLVLFIQFLGFVSFIKGMLILSKSATPGHQPGTFSKGLTHVIGGVVLINFIGAVNVLKNTVYGSS